MQTKHITLKKLKNILIVHQVDYTRMKMTDFYNYLPLKKNNFAHINFKGEFK